MIQTKSRRDFYLPTVLDDGAFDGDDHFVDFGSKKSLSARSSFFHFKIFELAPTTFSVLSPTRIHRLLLTVEIRPT